MTTYIRPRIEHVAFRDAGGNVIDYGNRWAVRCGPPDDSYSVFEHQERFAPLHTVAEALIDHLASTYDVDVEEGYPDADDLLHVPKPKEVVRTVQITPRSAGCATIVVFFTTFPGLHIKAGALFDARYPSCGCNACDEEWESTAEELEWQTMSIAAGGFTEEVSEPRRPKWSFNRGRGFVQGMGQTVSYRLRALDGLAETSGKSRAESVPAVALEQARATLEELAELSPEGNWQPWPLR